MNRICLKCDEPIVGPWAYRIRIGGVTYDEIHGPCFVQDPRDHFTDDTKTKWLCEKCACESGIDMLNLRLDQCLAPEWGQSCSKTFQPVEYPDNDEQILLVERGQLCPNNKGPGIGPEEMFEPVQAAHVHFMCACDGWSLPLWNLPPSDTP